MKRLQQIAKVPTRSRLARNAIAWSGSSNASGLQKIIGAVSRAEHYELRLRQSNYVGATIEKSCSGTKLCSIGLSINFSAVRDFVC